MRHRSSTKCGSSPGLAWCDALGRPIEEQPLLSLLSAHVRADEQRHQAAYVN